MFTIENVILEIHIMKVGTMFGCFTRVRNVQIDVISDSLFSPKGSISLLSLFILSKLRFLDLLVHSLGRKVGNNGLML
jgi:hypothetical protein